ncbi:clasp N terminal-domain-containing protein [Aspergillus californicus]
MEARAKDLLEDLQNGNLSIDTQVSRLIALKSEIKQRLVPEGAISTIFACLRRAFSSRSISLLGAAFSTLGHFVKRLIIQEQELLLAEYAFELYPVLFERLGDPRERHRAQAAQAFTDLWAADASTVESFTLDRAMRSRNPRTKEASLLWLSSMHQTHNILFRSYVPNVVACLEDADGFVRDTAKSTVVHLFEHASPQAKTDLMRQLAESNVRRSIVNVITAGIGLEEDLPMPQAENPLHRPAPRVAQQPPRPPSRGDALQNRPPSRGDALHNRPPSRGDALHNRPPSRGDALHNRPPSRGDALHNRPPSRGDALHNRPPSRGDALHNRPPSRGDALHNRPNPAQPRLRVDANASERSEKAESMPPASPALLGPVPVRPGPSAITKIDKGKAPEVPGASVDHVSFAPEEVIPLVKPLDVLSASDFVKAVRVMGPCFEGKETEMNWGHREQNIILLRRYTHGNAPIEFTQVYLDQIKIVLEGIFKVALSLRTTLSSNGCLMVQDMAQICGPRLDPMVDILMPHLFKLCASGKKITAESGNTTVVIVLENVTCNSRLITHVTCVAQEKNIHMRVFSAEWLRILISRQRRRKIPKTVMDDIEGCLKKGLLDPNPNIREAHCPTFWTFNTTFPQRAETLFTQLDYKATSLLEKTNPIVVGASSSNFTASHRGPFSNTSETPGPSDPKEAVAVGKKAVLVSTKNSSPATKAAYTALPDAVATDNHRKQPNHPRAVLTGTSSLSAAPMRPGVAKSRPAPIEVQSRPANAIGSRHVEERSTRVSPTRILAAHPSTPAHPSSPTQLAIAGSRIVEERSTRVSPTRVNPTQIQAAHPATPAHPTIPSQSASDGSCIVEERSTRVSPTQIQAAHPATPAHPTIPSQSASDGSCIVEERSTRVSPTQILAAHPSATPRPATATGSRPECESPTRVSPTRIPVAYPATPLTRPLGATRPRQKSDPLQDASPTKQRKLDDYRGSPARSCDTLHVPKRRRLKTDDMSNQKLNDNEFGKIDDLLAERGIRKISDLFDVQREQKQEEEQLEAKPFEAKQTEVKQDEGRQVEVKKPYEKTDENLVPRRLSVSIEHGSRRTSRQLSIGAEVTPTLRELLIDDSLPGSASDQSLPHEKVEATRIQNPVVDSGKTPRLNTTIPDLSIEGIRKSSLQWRNFEKTPPKRRGVSPRSRDPATAREMIVKGIERIRAGNLDILGYRKLQTLIEFHDTIFDDEEQFDFLLLALLERLHIPPTDGNCRLQTQVLATVRYMFYYAQKYFVGHCEYTVVSLLGAQKYYLGSSSYFIKGLQELMGLIIGVSDPVILIDAVVDMLDVEPTDVEGFKQLQAGLGVLIYILSSMGEKKMALPNLTTEHVGSLASRAMNVKGDHDIKRYVIAVTTFLRPLTEEAEFWKALNRIRSEKDTRIVSYYSTRTEEENNLKQKEKTDQKTEGH